jgi:hypothetical protein
MLGSLVSIMRLYSFRKSSFLSIIMPALSVKTA